eukprot:10340819-Karenia_brevis.AAC.1
MHLAATSACFDTLVGDMPALPTTGQWQSLFLPEGCELRWSSSDLKCCFYSYALPKVWWKSMAFSKPLNGAVFGKPGKKVYVCSAVVPMGWTSSTGIIQHIHRTVLLFALSPEA